MLGSRVPENSGGVSIVVPHVIPRARPIAAGGLVCACLAVLALTIPLIATGSRPAPVASVQPAPSQSTGPAAPQPVAALSFGEGVARTGRSGLAQAAVDAAQDTAQPSTELGVAVLDRVTGETAVGDRGGEPFYTASLAKLVVTVDVLDRRRTEGLVVTDDDLALIRRALGPSDDSAMNALWVRFDGVGSAARVAADLALTGTTAPVDPSRWGEMSVPAVDFLRLSTHVLDGLPDADQDLVIGALVAAPPTAADGFDQAFGLMDPAVDGPGAPGAVAKQGWMCCFSGRYYLHSAGVVGPDERYVVVVLTRIPQGPGWDAARAEVTAVASAAVRALTGPPD